MTGNPSPRSLPGRAAAEADGKMKMTQHSFAIYPIVISVAFFAGLHTTFAEDKTRYPGSEATLEQALQLRLDFIAVARLVSLGGEPSQLTPGSDVYSHVVFEIVSPLKGNASGNVKCMIFMDHQQPPGARGLQENATYIIFCKREANGVLVAGKILPDDVNTERAIMTAR